MRLRFENAVSRRYYFAWVQQDLFGPVVVRVWGGIGTSRGGTKTDSFESASAAESVLARLTRRLELRGYRIQETAVRENMPAFDGSNREVFEAPSIGQSLLVPAEVRLRVEAEVESAART